MSKVKCIFCHKKGKRAKEHVWPLWLQKHLGVCSEMRQGVHRSLNGQPISKRIQSYNSMKYGEICEKCNNGWMSDIESRVKSTLIKAIASRRVDTPYLDRTESSDLSIWCFKTVLILNAADNYRSIIPKAHYRYLYDNRTIPSNVFIDMGVCPWLDALSSKQTQNLIGNLLDEDDSALENKLKHRYNIVIGIDKIVFRVVYLPLKDYWVNTDHEEKNRTVRIHPSSGKLYLNISVFYNTTKEFAMNATFQSIKVAS